MRTEKEKDELLIRWLEGELSEQELADFEGSAEFDDYKSIIDNVENITYPQMDETVVFSNIQKTISSNKSSKKAPTKVIPLKRWVLAIASIAVLAFAVVTIFPKSTTVSSDIAQFVTHALPDGSEINLNGNSQINYKNNFDENRTLHLEGEAFFKVKKGESFKVETAKGVVSVLGTSFNIFARDEIFIVSCKTGKVKVESKNQSYILQKGDRIKLENDISAGKDTIDTLKIGNWIIGESYFSGASLEEVALSLSSLYDTQINLPVRYKNKRYTGSVVHNDLKKALKMIFSPMKIKYTIDDQGNVNFGE